MGDMIRCHTCQTQHYRNDPCPHKQEPEYIRFDAESWVVVCLFPHSNTVQMSSNLANEESANRYCRELELEGGHVFASVKAGVLIGALKLIKPAKRGSVKLPGE